MRGLFLVKGQVKRQVQAVADRGQRLRIQSVTGVDLELSIAGPGARAYAFVIDWHIRVLLALAWYVVGTYLVLGTLVVAEAPDPDFRLLMTLAAGPALGIYVLYHPVLELVMRGRTPGKRMAGVRIVAATGEVPGVTAILVRNVLRLVDSLPVGYMVGLMCTLFTDRSVRIGDMAAATLLVYDRDGYADTGATAAPAAVGQHGVASAELATDLLARWDTLDEARRRELARRLIISMGGEIGATHDEGLRATLKLHLGDTPHDG